MSRREFSHRMRQLLRSEPNLPFKLRPEVLLCANIPKPLHGLAPREILGRDWWDRTRRDAYRSTQYHCIACGVQAVKALFHQWLEGHEIYQIDYKRGLAVYKETVPLCHSCHCFIHDGRLKILLTKGEVTRAKYDQIMSHGRKILAQHGLVRKVYSGPTAEWGQWRLVLEGKRYSPKFSSYEAWAKFYGN